MSEESKTPLTDELDEQLYSEKGRHTPHSRYWKMLDHAKKLETALAEKTRELEVWKAIAERLAAYVRDVRVLHSGACLDFSKNPWVVTEESCQCLPAKRNAIAALRDFEELEKEIEP